MRRPEDLRNAFSYHPPYYRFADDVLNFVDYGPQNSRGFRALKVWLALQQIGRSGYIDSIAEDMRLSRKLYDLLAQPLGVRGLHANAQHHDVPVRAARTSREARRSCGGGVAERAQRGSARARSEERRGVLLERRHRRQVRAARLHRQLPHVG